MPDQPTFDVDRVSRLIATRRSLKPKDFSGEIIPRKDIERLLEAAHWAPNHGRTEPWHFIVYAGKGLDRLGTLHADVYQQHTPAEDFKQAKYDKMRTTPTRCSHAIVICMKRGENPKIPEIEEIEAVATSVQNLHLMATAMGIGGYWSSGGMTYHPALRDAMGLRESDRVLGFFLLGIPKAPWPEGTRKAPWQDKVRWEE